MLQYFTLCRTLHHNKQPAECLTGLALCVSGQTTASGRCATMQLSSISIYSSDAHKGVSVSLNWQAYGSLVCRGLEQEKQDLGRQVQTLLIQVQGGEAAEPVLRLTQGDDTGLVTSDDVISDRLLSFTDVQACTCLGDGNLLKACGGI